MIMDFCWEQPKIYIIINAESLCEMVWKVIMIYKDI